MKKVLYYGNINTDKAVQYAKSTPSYCSKKHNYTDMQEGQSLGAVPIKCYN